MTKKLNWRWNFFNLGSTWKAVWWIHSKIPSISCRHPKDGLRRKKKMPNENWTLFLMNMFFVLCVDMCNSAYNVYIMFTQCIFTPYFLSTYLKTRRWMSSIGAGCRCSESSPVSTTLRKYTTLCVSLQSIQKYASRWYMNTHVVEKDAAGPVL